MTAVLGGYARALRLFLALFVACSAVLPAAQPAWAAASTAVAYDALLDPQNQVQEVNESDTFLLDAGGEPTQEPPPVQPPPVSLKVFLPSVQR